MTPNPKGRSRFIDDDPDRKMRNRLDILIALMIVQIALMIGLWIVFYHPTPDTGQMAADNRQEDVASANPSEREYTPETVIKSAPVAEVEDAVEEAPGEAAIEEIIKPLRVQILNGCGANGIARKASNWFKKNGYEVGDVGNADRQDYSHSQIIDRAGNLTTARELANLLNIEETNIKRLSKTPKPEVDLTLIIGKDYKGLPFAR